MKCNGYWELCECEDCRRVAVLYAELDWYQQYEPQEKEIIRDLIEEIESMGYSV